MIGHLHRQGLSTGVCGASLSGNTQGLLIRVLWVTERRRRPRALHLLPLHPIWEAVSASFLFLRQKKCGSVISELELTTPHQKKARACCASMYIRACTVGDGTNRAASLKSAPSGYKSFRVAAHQPVDSRGDMRRMYSISKNFIRCVAS